MVNNPSVLEPLKFYGGRVGLLEATVGLLEATFARSRFCDGKKMFKLYWGLHVSQ